MDVKTLRQIGQSLKLAAAIQEPVARTQIIAWRRYTRLEAKTNKTNKVTRWWFSWEDLPFSKLR